MMEEIRAQQVNRARPMTGKGFVLGVGAKIFTVAGPVLLYGTAAGTLYGFIYWICRMFVV